MIMQSVWNSLFYRIFFCIVHLSLFCNQNATEQYTRRSEPLAVPNMLISRTKLKSCTILSSLHENYLYKTRHYKEDNSLCSSCMSGIADTSFRKKKVLGNYSNHLNSRQILYFHGITNQNPQREIL